MNLETQVRERRREERIADFALGSLLAAISASMGNRLPTDEDARDLVRVARVVFSEIDQPTEPTEPDEEPSSGRSEDHPIGDWKDMMYVGDADEGL